MIEDYRVVKKYRDYYYEINRLALEVFESWNKEIRDSYIDVSDSKISLRKYLAPEGGFRILIDEWKYLDKNLQFFFHSRKKISGKYIYLRGYQYYYCDPCMYLKDKCPSDIQLWNKLIEKWISYRKYIDVLDIFENKKVSFRNLIGIISYLEWIFNDLATINWVFLLLHQKNSNLYIYHSEICSNVELLSKVLVQISYKTWKENYIVNYEKIKILLKRLLFNEHICNFLKEAKKYMLSENKYVRAVREGDQLWIILATYEKKFNPWYVKNEYPKITFLNNAFGAINLGYIMKHQLKNCSNISISNIYFSIHEEEMQRYNNKVISHIYNESKSNDSKYYIMIDDSLFTGKTFYSVQRLYESNGHEILCLPLTFDIATIFNHPQEIGNEHMFKKVLNIENCVRCLGNNLTVARSYWVYKKYNKYTSKIENPEYNKVINGSDMLISLIWRRFEMEINT